MRPVAGWGAIPRHGAHLECHDVGVKCTAALAAFSLAALAACGASATVQEQAGDAVASFVNNDRDLSDAEFDTACLRRTALGLSDEVAQGIVDDGGEVDLDVDDDDRDDVYDFYNCADDRGLARLIEDQTGDVDARCLEDAFEDIDPGDFLSDADGDRPGSLGNFRRVVSCIPPDPEPTEPDQSVPETTVPDSIVPDTTTTTIPETTTTTTTTVPVATIPPTPAPTLPPVMEETPRPMGPDNSPLGFAEDAEIFLNDDQIVADAVGGDVDSVFCLTPSTANIGTRFLCFGSAVNFGLIEFEVEITEPAAYLVQDFRDSLTSDRILVFIILDVAFAGEDLAYDQICVRGFLANLPDDQVSTVLDDNGDMGSIAGLAPCIL